MNTDNYKKPTGGDCGVDEENFPRTGKCFCKNCAAFVSWLSFIYGTFFVTNCTVAYNSHHYSNGGAIYANDFTYIKNTIAANNDQDIYASRGGYVSDKGNNIIENYYISSESEYFTIASTTWTGEQSSLNLSDTLTSNSSLNGVPTLALEAGSLAINKGDGGSNGITGKTVPVPSADQRGFGRNSAIDISAYEHDGVAPAPVLTIISPTYGPPEGGNLVTFSGANFTPDSQVYFGGTTAAQVFFHSSTSLVAVAPAHVQQTVNAIVSTAFGESASKPYFFGSPPSISTHPGNKYITQGETTYFSVTASGSDLTCQWQVNTGSGFTNISDGGVYSGSTTATLTLTDVPGTMDNYTYRVVVSGTVGSPVTSDTAKLVVYHPEIEIRTWDDITIVNGDTTPSTDDQTDFGTVDLAPKSRLSPLYMQYDARRPYNSAGQGRAFALL
ncbi:MAG: IPT/TIG domain-containing protein [Oscillospiraceae bacterium]|jgi:hypothetical protein